VKCQANLLKIGDNIIFETAKATYGIGIKQFPFNSRNDLSDSSYQPRMIPYGPLSFS